MLVLLIEEFYRLLHCDGLCGMIYIPSFMKTDVGVQAILRFSIENLRGCNVGITDGRNL
jgi:hypothetical protein